MVSSISHSGKTSLWVEHRKGGKWSLILRVHVFLIPREVGDEATYPRKFLSHTKDLGNMRTAKISQR